jgi:hypothetical protein
MTRRVLHCVFALGLFCFCFAAKTVNAQQVTFSMSPSTLSPTTAVNDTVTLQVSVTNFTNIASFQYTIEWDPALLGFITVENVNIIDGGNFAFYGYGTNTITVGWNSTGTGRTLPNGQNIFRLRFKVKAASTNYWAKFSSVSTQIEVVQGSGVSIIPAFGNLGNPPGSSATPVSVQATTTQTVPTGTKACVNVTANDFTNITSAQWVTKWNPAVIRFDSISVVNNTLGLTGGNFNSTQASGRLALNWTAPIGTPKTIPTGSLLYRVCYTAIGANGTSSAVTFDSSQIFQSAAGGTVRVNMSGAGGTVNVNAGQSTGLIFTATNHVVNQNDQVCVQVKTAGFNRIAAITSAIFFDSSKMTLVRANITPILGGTDTLFAGGSSASYNNSPSGTIQCLWFDPTTAGVTLPDSSVIMELCFKYTGAPGTSSLIRFGAYRSKQVIKDGDLVTVPATYRNGSISVIAVASPITVTGTTKNVTCPTGTDGGVTLTASGGAGGAYTYLWSNAATTKDITNVAAGKYKVTITSGATTKIDSFTVVEPTAITAPGLVTPVSCFGQSTGSINLTTAGGTSGYTYLWSNNATTQNLSNLTAGNYTVVVTDSKGCTYTSPAIAVTQPVAPLSILSATKTNVACKSGSDGAINISVAGGTSSYTYSWLGNASYTNNIQNITGLKADIYNLTVTDSKGCTVSKRDTISEPDSLLIGAATIRNTNCGSQSGAITITGVTGGNATYSFAWTGSNYTANTQNISNLGAGQYTLTVKDSKQCSATKSVTVIDSTSTIVINAPTTITQVKCNGGTDGAIAASGTGGTGALTYKWAGPNSFSSTVQSINGLRAGTYNVSISDASGCFKSASYEITQPAALALTPSVTNVKCKNDQTGAIALNATGGSGTLTFAWTGATATTQNITNLKAGAYSVIVTDANTCSKTQAFTITEPTDSLKVLSSSIAKVTCAGSSNGAISITVGGGTQSYTYSWAGPSGFSSTAQNINTLIAGTYRLTMTDANQCSYTASYNVDSNPAIVVNASVSDATRSPNGTITLTTTGGTPQYTYLWSGQGVNPTSKDQSGLCPGTYNVTITDNIGCQLIKSYVIGGECSTPMTFSSAITAAGCPGQNLGKIDLSILGGAAPYIYTWRNAASDIIGRDRALTGLTSGIYTILVEDRIGQRRLETYTVEGSQTAVKIASVAIASETCAGADGSITLNPTGGALNYTYKWNDGVTSKDRPNQRAGTFSVTIADGNGCLKDTNNIIIPRIPCPLVSITTAKPAKCNGDNNGSVTVNIQNGEPGYVIKWSARDSVIINNQPSRNGTYEITGLRGGTYSITITDARSQSKVETASVPQPTQIRIEKTITPVTSGCNGSILLTVSGGEQPFTYNWNTGATSRDLFGLCCDTTKKYSVTVRDNAGCIASTGNDTLSCIIAAMSVNANVTNPICKADSMSGRIELTIIGGSAGFTYTWTNDRGAQVGNNSPLLSNVAPGRYFVTVTDSRLPNPQRFQSSYILSVTSTLALANLVVTAATDDLTPDGKAQVDIQGGSPDFSIAWSNNTTSVATNTARTPSVSNLYPGVYGVVVTDRNGCRERIDNILIPSKSCATLETLSQIKCFGDQNGSARVVKVSPDMTLPIQSYLWSSGETGSIAFKLKAGLDSVVLTDATGKKCTARVILNGPAQLTSILNFDIKTKVLEGTISGGVKPYSIKWIPSLDTSHKITIAKSGTYYFFATDRNGCIAPRDTDIIIGSECLVGSVIISPNDDSRNESFDINACDFKNIRLEVYNRWGQLVYAKDNYTSGIWQGNDQDGTVGKQLPEGVYMYIMRANDSSGKPTLGKGTVTIVRQ